MIGRLDIEGHAKDGLMLMQWKISSGQNRLELSNSYSKTCLSMPQTLATSRAKTGSGMSLQRSHLFSPLRPPITRSKPLPVCSDHGQTRFLGHQKKKTSSC